MTIDDFFNKGDRLLERFDQTIIGLHAQVANYWQRKTGYSKEFLSRGAHSIAAVGYATVPIVGGPLYAKLSSLSNEPVPADVKLGLYLLPVVCALGTITEGLKVQGYLRSKPRHVESLQALQKGKDLHRKRNFDLYRLLSGSTKMAVGTGLGMLGFVYGISELLAAGMAIGGFGGGLALGVSGDHFDRIDVGPPQRETVRAYRLGSEPTN
jgi:hypothetical protein